MGFMVRDASGDDAEVVAQLYLQLRDHHARLDPEALRYRTDDEVWIGWAQDLLEDPRQQVRLAEEGGRVVGMSCLEFVQKPWGIACEIHTLIIRAGARSEGAGGSLLRDAEDLARAKGARGMRVDVLAPNHDGRRFYEERGYKTSAVRYAKDL